MNFDSIFSLRLQIVLILKNLLYLITPVQVSDCKLACTRFQFKDLNLSSADKHTFLCNFPQLFGAATMNNTMCLAVFMALVYFKDLKWYYGAEVLCIVIVQWIVGLISLTRTYKVSEHILNIRW